MKVAYGIKEPKIENRESILKKSKKFGFKLDNIATVSPNDYVKLINSYGIPDAIIFDKKGNCIEYKENEQSCNAGLFDYVPKLGKDIVHKISENTNLQIEKQKLKDLNGEKYPELKEADYYLFIYWTVFTGKLNKDHVKVWEDLAYSNQNCKIEIIKVNLDIQEYWDEKTKNKIINLLEKKH